MGSSNVTTDRAIVEYEQVQAESRNDQQSSRRDHRRMAPAAMLGLGGSAAMSWTQMCDGGGRRVKLGMRLAVALPRLPMT